MTDERFYFRFAPTGEVFELKDRMKLPEIVWAEHYLGVDMAEAKGGTRSVVFMFMTVRRSNPKRWNEHAWAELDNESFEPLTEDDDDHPDHVDNQVPEEGTPDPTEGSAPDHERAAALTS